MFKLLKKRYPSCINWYLSYGRDIPQKIVAGQRWMSKYFLTTPIFYVNAAPHIGHLYTSVIADAIARYQKLKNPNLEIKLMSGTDEHGLKIRLAARSNNKPEEVYCDEVSLMYRKMFGLYSVKETDFLRTTELRHKKTVQEFWKKIDKNGYIYSSEYSGWYCVADEAFIPEKDLEKNTESDGTRYTIEGHKITHFANEINYKFKLSHFQDDLLYWLKNENVVTPNKFCDLLKDWITNGSSMSDLSISRPVERIQWGIPVPNDPSQLIYVWFDALSCYLSTTGYPNNNFKWPPDLQIIGKDILKFHGIYWPAFLIAAGLEPPNRLLCHSHWLVEGEKMSKSIGNVIDPFEKADLYGGEQFRYFLLREAVPHSDANFSEEKILKIINSDLSDKIGNLLRRCTTSRKINKSQIFPGFPEHRHVYCKHMTKLIKSLENLPDNAEFEFEKYDFHKYVDRIFSTIALTNELFNLEEPWNLAKDPKDEDRLLSVLHITMESLRVCGILLQPIIPNKANALLNKLGIPEDKRFFGNIRPFSWEKGSQTEDTALTAEEEVLFPKIYSPDKKATESSKISKEVSSIKKEKHKKQN